MTAPTTLMGRILAVLNGYDIDAAGQIDHLTGSIRAVVDLHRPFRIYDDCGHQPHEYAEDGTVAAGMVEIEGVGLVCEDGYEYSICRHCCADVVDGQAFQSEECASRHRHRGSDPCHPCETVRVIAAAMGVDQ